jgi:hypothetical protein
MSYKPTYGKLSSKEIEIIQKKTTFPVTDTVVEMICNYLGCREDLNTVSKKHEIRLVQKRWDNIWSNQESWKIQVIDQIGLKEKLWH